MSLLRPKDDDYILRGLFLLVTWFAIGWLPFAVVGALLAGAGGATIGFILSIPLGLWGYSAYLNWGLRNICKKPFPSIRLPAGATIEEWLPAQRITDDEFANMIEMRRKNRGLPNNPRPRATKTDRI